jgi:hypothetical protein
MPQLPPYFDSQASAAAALKIDIRVLRELKRTGCPAFHSGRVYTQPLLKCMAQNKSKRARRKTDSGHDEVKNALCEAMTSLATRFRDGLISSDVYFDRVTNILSAVRGYLSSRDMKAAAR